jgi:hypothetical protein
MDKVGLTIVSVETAPAVDVRYPVPLAEDHTVPPSVLTSHCRATLVPLVLLVKLVLLPEQIVTLCGCEVITGAVLTVRVAALETPGVGQVLFDNCARYIFPFIEAGAPVMVSVAEVAPL